MHALCTLTFLVLLALAANPDPVIACGSATLHCASNDGFLPAGGSLGLIS